MTFITFISNIDNNVYILLLYGSAACLLYYLLPQRMRNTWLFFCSILFYALCSRTFLFLILSETEVSWWIGKKVRQQRTARVQTGNDETDKGIRAWRVRGWLVCGIICCIGILFLFKYWNFFIEEFGFEFSDILMPVGISYYSFRIVSYLADIDTGKREPEGSFVIYAVYVMFFPQLLSGPIARSEDMTERMHRGISLSSGNIDAGTRLILSGLFKKVVIADRISAYPTTIFAAPDQYPALAAWLGAILYSIQLYCDFAGYSEIAIGITRCFGFECPDNFIRPYLSSDMKEFWRRWHVSLGSWLRDYIYIPCGGNRVNRKWKVKRNVMITFAACGLWHGAGLKYFVWGLYHGFWNILVPSGRKGKLQKPASMNRKCVRRGLHAALHGCMCVGTFLIAMFGWILFKAESFAAAGRYVLCMFRSFSLDMQAVEASIMPFTNDNSCAAYAVTAFLLILLLFVMEIRDERASREKQSHTEEVVLVNPSGYSNLLCGILLALILLFGASGTGSFLYANY